METAVWAPTDVRTGEGPLDSVGDVVTLALRERPYVGVHISNSQAMTGTLLLEFSANDGVTFDPRFFWNGDAWVNADILPNASGINERNWFSGTLPGDTHARVRVSAFVAGAASGFLVGSYNPATLLTNPAFALSGNTAAPGGNHVALLTGAGLASRLAGDVGGRAIVRPWGPVDFSVVNAPGVNVQAISSIAAGGVGVRHVCTSVNASFVAGPAAPVANAVQVVLRDGASGVGPILIQQQLALQGIVGDKDRWVMSGLHRRGSPNTAMTLEFVGAGGANTIETVSLVGVTITEA